ncbi:hypothetical protein ACFDTO_24420 [Microbacteriaceae bacterium 4G12]
MKLQMNDTYNKGADYMKSEANFLTVVQQSGFKRDASISQLLFTSSEDVEELVDDYGYEEILSRDQDEELVNILGEELFEEMQQYVFSSSNPQDQLITFMNGLGFHVLDLIVILETEFHINSQKFTPDVIKKLEKRLPHFPYIEGEKTIFSLTVAEVFELLHQVTDGVITLERA